LPSREKQTNYKIELASNTTIAILDNFLCTGNFLVFCNFEGKLLHKRYKASLSVKRFKDSNLKKKITSILFWTTEGKFLVKD
jgi:hypothetical protein